MGGRVAPRTFDDYARFIRSSSARAGSIARSSSCPPTRRSPRQAAAGQGLTAPELAVLLAYAKISLYDVVLASALPDDPWVAHALVDYFPAPLRERFAAAMARHPLKREIIANVVINQTSTASAPRSCIARPRRRDRIRRTWSAPHLLTREVFALRSLWHDVEALDNQVDDEVQARMLIDGGRLAARDAFWFLRSPRLHADMGATIAAFAPAIDAVGGRVAQTLEGGAREDVESRTAGLLAARVPEDLARRVAALDAMAGALDIVEVAQAQQRDVADVAEVYFRLGHRLELDWLAHRIGALDASGHWEVLARQALRDDVAGLQRALARDVLARTEGGTAAARIDAWEATHRGARDRAARVVEELKSAPAPDLAMLSVALRELRNLAANAAVLPAPAR